MKDDVDLILGSQKSLRLSGRFEPPHHLLSFAGRLMGPLDAVVEPFVRAMISFRRKSPDRLDVTAQFVCHDDTQFAKAGNQPRKEALGGFGISVRLNKDRQHVPVRIHRPTQPLLHAVDQNDDFVQMPFVCGGGAVTLDAIGKCLPNRFTHLRTVSRLTVTPPSASKSSTSAVLSAKR